MYKSVCWSRSSDHTLTHDTLQVTEQFESQTCIVVVREQDRQGESIQILQKGRILIQK